MKENRGTCRDCGRPIRFVEKPVDGWVHDDPLGKLRISPEERDRVLRAKAEHGHGPDRIYGLIHRAAPMRAYEGAISWA